MGFMETFQGMSKGEKISIAVGAAGIVLMIWQPWKAKTSTTTSLDYPAASGTASAGSSAEIPIANDYSSITQTMSAITSQMQTNQDATNKALADQENYLTSAINRLSSPAIQTVAPVAPVAPVSAITPVVLPSKSYGDTIASSNYADRANPKTNYEMTDNSKQSVPKGAADYDVVRANLKPGETSLQGAMRIYGTI